MIPVSEPLLAGAEARYVADCIQTGWISSEGGYLAAFEQAWAKYCGAEFGVGVSNGTTALQIAVAALDLEPGSEIILPSFTIISCSLAIVEASCVPVLVDVDPETWALDLDQVEAKITDKTRAILPVHMFGHPVDMPRLMKIATKHNLKVIEDAAEAHGAEVDGRKVGGIGDLATFSFYANKIITTGEGGMVLTSDERIAERLRSLRNLCFKRERRFYHTELGHNYRLTNLQAAIGLAQLERIDDHLRRKRWMAASYAERLRDLNQLRLPVELPGYKNVYWMYSIVLSDDVPFDAVEFAKRLQQLGVQTRPLFLGMHEQPVFHERGLHLNERYPVTERLARRGVYLPSGLTLTIEQIDAVSDAVHNLVMTGIFNESYASAYDAMYADKDNIAECDAVIALFRRHGDQKISRILDLGCGTGRHAIELAGRGFDVTGVDFSAAMLDRARERGHSSTGSLDFVKGDARSYRSAKPFDAVLMNFNVLGYMNSNEDFTAALSTAQANLRAGGLFVADFWYGPAVVMDLPGERLREITAGDTRILRCSKGTHDPDRQCIRIAIRVIEIQQGQIRSDSEEVHTMRYFFPLELELALKSHGFRLVALTGYPDIEESANGSQWLAAFCAVAV